MSKRKRPARGDRQRQPHTRPTDQRQLGLQSFRAGRLDEATTIWSSLAQRDTRLEAALAEAYFRRALMHPAGQDQVADLQRATALAPDDLRYQYHLGLALHRVGDLPLAVERYRTVLAHDDEWPGAGMMLALAALERDAESDLGALPGSTPEVLQNLAPVQALLRGEMPAPDGDEPVSQLWRGLGLVQTGDAAAREVLDHAHPLRSQHATAVHTYYQGVAAAQAGDLEAAFHSWQHLSDQPTHMPWLQQNLAALLPRYLRECYEAGDLERAVSIAQHWFPLATSSPAVGEAVVQTLDRAAHAADAGEDWARAIALWEGARQVVSSSRSLGSPRPLLHNLALAYEAQERWLEAADAWRAMLRTRQRTRPRDGARSTKEPATQPATSAPVSGATGRGLSEAQWSWVRARVIECYKRAGAPGEAVAIFRQAIKANPKDLELRLQLADALLANEQEQAAINELQRLLQIDPQHVESRLRLAAAHRARGNWHMAEQMLRQVLRQHPEQPEAQRQLVRLLLEHGQYLLSSGYDDAAASMFEEGQRLAPDDYQFPLNLARIAINRRQPKRARPLLECALTLGAERPLAYAQVIECWAVLDEIDEARAVLRQAEAALPLTFEFYVNLGVLLLKRTAPRSLASPFAEPPSQPADTPWSRLAEETLDHARALQPGDAQVSAQIAAELLELRPDLAMRYAQEAVAVAPDDPRSLMVLGLVQALKQDTREARDSLRRAADLARKQHDISLARDIDALRQQVGSPLLRLALRMGPFFDDLDLEDEI